jgi:PAS domain S-box-containing protein
MNLEKSLAAGPERPKGGRRPRLSQFKDALRTASRSIKDTNLAITAAMMSIPSISELFGSWAANRLPFNDRGDAAQAIAETAILGAISVAVSSLAKQTRRQKHSIDAEYGLIKRELAVIREEREYEREILESSPLSIVVFGLDGMIMDCNRAAARDSGYGRKGLEGREFLSLIAGKDRPAVMSKIEALLSTGEHQEANCACARKNGTSYSGELSIRVVKDAKGSPRFVVTTIRDITEREALIGAQKMECVALLAGGVAHDFNNLLCGIGTNAQMLEMADSSRNMLSCDDKECISGILSAVRVGSDLTRRFLDFGRQGEFAVEKIDVGKAAADAGALFKYRLKHSSIKFSVSASKDCAMMASHSRMCQLMMNLCINAMEAIDREHGEIALSAFRAGERVVIDVSDNGCGMNAEVKKRIFEPYFTTKNRPDRRGHGLGLAIVYAIVHDYGGIIDVDTEQGKGTRFTISFPAA